MALYMAARCICEARGYGKDATFENPDIGSEFGFAQEMFRSATDRLNTNSDFVNYMSMGKMEPRDVQAIAWFLEKDRWDKGGWTSEAGGNYSDELQFAGQVDKDKVNKDQASKDKLSRLSSLRFSRIGYRFYLMIKSLELNKD